jgi:hypothetical protein
MHLCLAGDRKYNIHNIISLEIRKSCFVKGCCIKAEKGEIFLKFLHCRKIDQGIKNVTVSSISQGHILEFFKLCHIILYRDTIIRTFKYFPASGPIKEVIMKALNCAPQKISKLLIGFAGVLFGVALFILGITLLPVLGIFLSLPTFAMAATIFKEHLNDQCELMTN